MAVATTPFLLVTANVGSIFEDPAVMLKIWTREFLATVTRLDPKFIGLHCQEVGGKNYEESMQYVSDFVKLLMESEELRLFDKVRIYLDEDYSSAENFTALGNFYFIHESVNDVLMWDFQGLCFEVVEGKMVYAGDIENVSTKEKSKFPQDFFPECKWSRKGFMRTRWNLNGTVFDLINIHLFHDASNFVAMETFPSVYSKTRQRALEYTLDRFHNDEHGTAPFFLFGDFNFRTDTRAVIEKLCDGLDAVHSNNGKNSMVEYKNADSEVILTLGKKEFRHNNHQAMFLDQLWLKEFDKEIDDFCTKVYEFPIHFPPSYPFVEDSSSGVSDYMETRCPAWCDRVLLSQTARPLVHGNGEDHVEYGLIGKTSCMGDHKPVYILGYLEQGAGRLSCCESHKPQTPLVKFDLESLPGETALAEPQPVDERTGDKPMTERYLVKRVNSASVVEVKVGLLRGNTCSMSAGDWRSRSVSVSNAGRGGAGGGGMGRVTAASRVRLISTDDLNGSLHRLQSHHSSSGEEWFEEDKVNSEEELGCSEKEPELLAANSVKSYRRKRNKCCAIC